MSMLAHDGRPATDTRTADVPPAGLGPAPYGPHAVPYAAAPYPHQPAAPATEPLAIVGLVAAFVAPVVGLVIGLVARARIARTGAGGRGLATAAIAVGGAFSALWVGIVALIIVGGAFSASFSTSSVPADSVESRIVAAAELPPGSVDCADDLPAVVGAQIVCTATLDGQVVPLDVTVTDVRGDDVSFDIESR